MNASIVIPLFNRWDMTERCLAVLDGIDAEIVTVDNGSTDETSQADVTIRNPENRGFAVACNQGARAASGDVLVFLNNDTEPHPGWLDALLAVIARPHVVAVGPKLVYPDGTVQCAGVGVDFSKPFGAEAWNITQDAPRGEAQALTGACMAVRADAFFEVGGFDRGYWNGYEDIDLCLALREQGGRLMYEPSAVVMHHESASDQTERFRAARTNIARLRAKWSM